VLFLIPLYMSDPLDHEAWRLAFVTATVSVSLGVFRRLFDSEINYLIGVIITYFHRPFDLDNDGTTHDWCLLRDSASGSWTYVSLLYQFNLVRPTSGVLVHRYDESWSLVSVQRMSFDKWKLADKARINADNLPDGLAEKIQELRHKHL